MTDETTPAAFIKSLVPTLSFTAPSDEPPGIPQGLLACCHVTHQVHCTYHVARTLVGAISKRKLSNGEEEEWIHPHPVDMEGDILAEPSKLWAAVKAHWHLALQTAHELDATLVSLEVGVYTLNNTQAALFNEATAWYYARLREQAVRHNVHLTAEMLNGFPVDYVPDDPDEVTKLISSPSWVPLDGYPEGVMVYPGEIGHDGGVRYIRLVVWPAPEREAMGWIEDPDPFPREEAPA